MKDGKVWGWTEERRLKQAQAIRRWKPWLASTGPTTAAGKAISSRNASKPDAIRKQIAAIKAELAHVLRLVKKIEATRKRSNLLR